MSGFVAAGGAARADTTGVVSVISVPGYGGLLTTAASKVYLATGSSSGILAFSSNGTELPTIADAGNITGMYASPDGTRLYIEHSNVEAIEVISTATDAPIQTYDTSTIPLNPLVPWQLAQTGKWLFVLGHPVGGMGSSPYVIDTSQPTPTIRGLSFTGIGGLLMTVAATTLAGGTVGVDIVVQDRNRRHLTRAHRDRIIRCDRRLVIDELCHSHHGDGRCRGGRPIGHRVADNNGLIARGCSRRRDLDVGVAQQLRGEAGLSGDGVAK